MNKEIWRDILGSRGLYQISNKGRYRSLHPRFPSNYLVAKTSKKRVRGYPDIIMYLGDKVLRVTLHKAAWEAFNGPIKKGKCINHKDGNKNNYCLVNLEVVSYSENNKHAYDTRLKINPTGDMWHASKLRSHQVEQIKIRLKYESMNKIAKIYKVNPSTIRDIKLGVTWKNIGCAE